MKLDRDTLMKIGIVAAVALIIYLVYRSRKCKDSYTNFVPQPQEDYAENMYMEDAADYAEEGDGDDYYEEEYQQHGQHGQENYTLMESTLDDDQANAMFEPEG